MNKSQIFYHMYCINDCLKKFENTYTKIKNSSLLEKIENLNDKIYSKVRIASIWSPSISYNVDIYKNVAWYFAGGVFGGNKDFLLDFANKTKEKCIHIIEKQNTIMWEVNIWFLIYLENKDLFDYYSCDHNNTIIDNY